MIWCFRNYRTFGNGLWDMSCIFVWHKFLILNEREYYQPTSIESRDEMKIYFNTRWSWVAQRSFNHYIHVIMSTMTSQITGVSTVCSAICSGADQIKHQSSASLALVRGIRQWPVVSPHRGPATRKMCLFDDVIHMSIIPVGPIYLDQYLFSQWLCCCDYLNQYRLTVKDSSSRAILQVNVIENSNIFIEVNSFKCPLQNVDHFF